MEEIIIFKVEPDASPAVNGSESSNYPISKATVSAQRFRVLIVIAGNWKAKVLCDVVIAVEFKSVKKKSLVFLKIDIGFLVEPEPEPVLTASLKIYSSKL